MRLHCLAPAPQDLPADESIIDTGYMGDCSSVIVMWDPDGGRYARVRGRHGRGGAVDLPSLLQDVPADPRTRIFLAMGASSVGANGDDEIERFVTGLPGPYGVCRITCLQPSPWVRLNREGDVLWR